jgi:hypothetical protein
MCGEVMTTKDISPRASFMKKSLFAGALIVAVLASNAASADDSLYPWWIKLPYPKDWDKRIGEDF